MRKADRLTASLAADLASPVRPLRSDAATPSRPHPRSRRILRAAAAFEGLESRRLMSAVGIAATDPTATEADQTTGTFTFTRSETEGALSVKLTVAGTATAGTDYETIPATVDFEDGEATATITVTPKDDAAYEGPETVTIAVAAGTGYTIDADHKTAAVTIADDDKATISIAGFDSGTTEGALIKGVKFIGVGKFTISRDFAAAEALPVSLTITGTATNGTDYQTIASTVTIPSGKTSVDITVTPIDDTAFEGDEKLKIAIATDDAYKVASGAGADATVTIADDDAQNVKVVAADATGVEGSATDTIKYTFTRVGYTTAALTVKYALTGTATKGTDFDDLTGSVVIPAGKASVDLVVKTKQDTTFEGPETVILTLSTDDAYQLDTEKKAATATITDDDKTTVSLVASDVTANETGRNTSGKFTVSRDGPIDEALTVTLALTGTAKNGQDYKSIPTTVKFKAGKRTATIVVKAKDDDTLEGDETVIITLATGTTYVIDGANKTGTVTLGDDEVPTVSIVATDANAAEPKDNGLFTVTRDGPTTAALVVNYAITGNATNGTDYETVATSVTIPAGKASATIAVTAKDDEAVEGNEKVILTLSDSEKYDQDAELDAAVVTLADNEKPTITITANDATSAEEKAAEPVELEEGEEAPEPAPAAVGEFTVTRTGPTTEAITVPITIGGTATNGTDYEKVELLVTIAAGQASKKISVKPIDDENVELDETVIATLVAGKTYTLGEAKVATVTITENDLPVITLTGTDVAAGESGDKATLTITRTGPTAAALDVKYAVTGSATNGTDYATLSGTATIPAGKAAVTIVLTPTQDTSFEGPETAIVTLTANAKYELDGAKKAATIALADDELPTVSIMATDATADEADADKTGEFTITRDGPTDLPLDVFVTAAGTAVTGKDTTAAIGSSVTIPAGKASVKVSIVGKDDSDFEGDETVVLSLKDSAKTYKLDAAKKSGTVTIADGDKPTVSIAATKAAVKENGKDAIVFTVSRTGFAGDALTVSLKPGVNGVNADDVSAALPTSITIPAGKLFSTVTISPKNDSVYEGTETLTLGIDEGTAYLIDNAKKAAEATIADDELPTVSIVASDSGAAETGSKTGKFTVSRGIAANDELTVTVMITGTAKNGRDYTTIAKTVTIAAGSSSADITVKPKTDSLVEGPESVTLTLAKAAPYALNADAAKLTATVTIADTQKASVAVEALDAKVDESSDGTAFRVYRTGRTAGAPLSVKFALTGTATGSAYKVQDEDGATLVDSVTIPQGESYVDVFVTPVDNATDNEDATVIFTVEEDDAYSVDADDGEATITIGDDDAAV